VLLIEQTLLRTARECGFIAALHPCSCGRSSQIQTCPAFLSGLFFAGDPLRAVAQKPEFVGSPPVNSVEMIELSRLLRSTHNIAHSGRRDRGRLRQRITSGLGRSPAPSSRSARSVSAARRAILRWTWSHHASARAPSLINQLRSSAGPLRAGGLGPKRQRVRPHLLPLLDKLHGKLHGVHRGHIGGIWPSTRRAETRQGF
jgi:hypothetical protein